MGLGKLPNKKDNNKIHKRIPVVRQFIDTKRRKSFLKRFYENVTWDIKN